MLPTFHGHALKRDETQTRKCTVRGTYIGRTSMQWMYTISCVWALAVCAF
jgi:hypothetical protein